MVHATLIHNNNKTQKNVVTLSNSYEINKLWGIFGVVMVRCEAIKKERCLNATILLQVKWFLHIFFNTAIASCPSIYSK